MGLHLVAQATTSIDFAPDVAPQVCPYRCACFSGFPPTLVDALLNEAAVRDVLSWRERDSKEHEEGEELRPVNILDEVRQRSGNGDGLLSYRVRHQTSARNTEVRVLALVD